MIRDIIGEIVGSFKVVKVAPQVVASTVMLVCNCIYCDREKQIWYGDIITDNKLKLQCGCGLEAAGKVLKKYRSKVKRGINPKFYTRTYQIWKNIKRLVYDRKVKGYYLTGGRGIGMQRDWLESYDKFLEDMGKLCPSGYGIRRYDLNKDFTKDNCYWGDYTDGTEKRKHIVRLENEIWLKYKDEEYPLKEWAKLLRLKPMKLYSLAGRIPFKKIVNMRRSDETLGDKYHHYLGEEKGE